MSEVLMIHCDNPVCSSVGHPEYVPWEEQGRKRRKSDKITGPYGWIDGEGWMIGCGPNYSFIACSLECISHAIEDKIRLAREAENG